MIYLFNKLLELQETVKHPLSATMRRKLNGANELEIEDLAKQKALYDASEYIGHHYGGRFYLYRKRRVQVSDTKLAVDGIDLAWDELKSADLIKDKRPTETSADMAIEAALEGTGYVLGRRGTTSINSTNFYYENPLDAIKKVVDIWRCELDFYFEFDGKKITKRVVDVYQRRGSVTGETYVYGKSIASIVHEEVRDTIVTALYPRGRGLEVKDETTGEATGGYTRKLTIADAVWSKASGDPVDKPLGQEYVELPDETIFNGNFGKPRFGDEDFDTEDPLELLKLGYQRLLEMSRPLLTMEATVAKAGPYELGDTNYILRGDIGLKYAARIFEDEIDLLRPQRTTFKFGDYIPSKLVKEVRDRQKEMDALKREYYDRMRQVIDQTKDLDMSIIDQHINDAVSKIIGGNLGHKVDIKNEAGDIYATAWMDTTDINTAQDFVYVSKDGIAFGGSGINSPEIAITNKGEIAGDSAFFRSLMTNLIMSDIGSKLDLRSNEGITLMVTSETQSYIDANKDSLRGSDGKGISSETAYYGLSTTATTAPTSWQEYPLQMTPEQPYLWTFRKVTYTDGTETITKQIVIGNYALDGADGQDGVAGKDGVGLSTTTVTYVGSTSGTVKPTTGWTSTIPTVAPGNFLWTKTAWTYSDGRTETGYSVSRIGKDGNTGSDGIAGKDGVGVTSTAITYASSTSGTTPPGSWSTAIPTVSAGNYLWTRTVWTYSDNTTETGYSVARMGLNGASGKDGVAGKDGVGIVTTTITYAGSTSGTTAPSTGWTTTIPTVAPGSYLWTKTVWTYSDATSETGYSVSRIGANGNDGANGIAGKDGVGVKSTLIQYASSTSGTTAPTTWSTTVPSAPAGYFIWTKTTWTYTDGTTETGYSVGKIGTNGTNGTNGKDGASVWIRYSDDKTTLSTTDTGQKYMGFYTGLTASTIASDYNWVYRTPEDGQVVLGTTNLVRYDKLVAYSYATVDKTQYLTDGSVRITSAGNTDNGLIIRIDDIKPDTEYVLAFEVTLGTGTSNWLGGSTDPSWSSNKVWINGSSQANPFGFSTDLSSRTQPIKYVVVFKTPSAVTQGDAIKIAPNKNNTVVTTMTLNKLRLYEGNAAPNDWTPHPMDPVKQGIFEITPNGWKTSNNVDGVSMFGEADGIRVKDNITNQTIMQATSAGVEAPVIYAKNVYASNLATRINGYHDFYIDGKSPAGDQSGIDWANAAPSLTEAMNARFGRARVMEYGFITATFRNTTAEDISLEGYVGKGSITLTGFSTISKLYGSLAIRNCNVEISVKDFVIQKATEADEGIRIDSTPFVSLSGMKMDGQGGIMLRATDGGVVSSSNNTYASCSTAMYARLGGIIISENDKGSGNTNAIISMYGGSAFYRGTRPEGAVTSGTDAYVKGTATATADPWALSPPTYGTVTRTFTADLLRYNKDSGWETEGAFAQGTSPSNGNTYVGKAKFLSSISSWLKSNGGYQNMQTPKITVTRGNWGYGDKQLKITSPATQSSPLVSRGSTSSFLSTALKTAIETSTDLTLTTSTTSTADYSDWTKISITVTADKKQ